MVTLKDQVMYCLQNYPHTRNSDITLMIILWKEFCGVENEVHVSRLYDLPREDNIKRVRAKIQNVYNLYLPTSWLVAKQRKINEDIWRNYVKQI